LTARLQSPTLGIFKRGRMRSFLKFWGLLLALSGPVFGAPSSRVLSELQNRFLEDHRVFQKLVEGKARWNSTFCQGIYDYRLLLQTQIKDVNIELQDDGSVVLEAELWEPYIGFQGNYQGAYSLCIPVGAWSGIKAETAFIRAHVVFFEKEEGRVNVNVNVEEVHLGLLVTNALSPSFEKSLTETLNQGLKEVWSSELGDWANEMISDLLNQNIPIHL